MPFDSLPAIRKELRKGAESIGFRKRKETFWLDLSPGIFGWLGLMELTYPSRGALDIIPKVGIRHQELEDFVSETLGEKPEEWGVVSTCIEIAGLVPLAFFGMHYEYSPKVDNDKKLEEMLSDLKKYAIPFMRKHANLPGILKCLKKEWGWPHMIACRIPAIHYLEGNVLRARKAMSKMARKYKDQPVVQQYAPLFLARIEDPKHAPPGKPEA